MWRVGDVMRWRRRVIAAASVLGAALVTLAGAGPAGASTLPSGFRDSVVLSGLTNPTVLQFAPDGRIFVAEKNGVIKVFDNLTDTTPTIFADLPDEVYDYWDRGLLGMALAPNFPANPYVYVLYTYDAPIGGTAPTLERRVPDPARADHRRLPRVSGRLSRLRSAGNVMTGTEQVLINDWCQQFPSHSIGDLLFGPDGALYVDRRRGRELQLADYGQYGGTYAGDLANPCGDPPGGGRHRAERRPAPRAARCAPERPAHRGPATLDGASSGSTRPPAPACPATRARARRTRTPAGSSPTACATRSASRRARAPTSSGSATSAGTPGRRSTASSHRPAPRRRTSAGRATRAAAAQGGYQAPTSTSAQRCTRRPARSSRRTTRTTTARSVVTATAARPAARRSPASPSTTGGDYPRSYNGALFFADHTRNCIWAMLPGHERPARPDQVQTFVGVDAAGGAPASGRPGDRPRRRPLLRRHGRRHRPPDHLHGRQPAADRGDHGDPDLRPRAADGQLRRHRLVRPGGQAAHATRGTSTATARSTTRPARRPRYTYTTAGIYTAGCGSPTPGRDATRRRSPITGRQHRADPGHRHARVEPDLEGRRHDHLHRPRHRRAGRHAAARRR